jgi:hypothetical protein
MRPGMKGLVMLLSAGLVIASALVSLTLLSRLGSDERLFREDNRIRLELGGLLVDSHERNEARYRRVARFTPDEGEAAETSDLWMMAAPDSKSFGEANIGGDHFEIVAIALAGSRPRCIVILSTDIRYLHSGDGVRWYEYSVGTGPKPNMIDVTLELHVDVSGGFRSHD